MSDMPLSFNASPKLERNLLKDQVTDLLRDYMISGHIAPGTKLVERNVAELLHVSRAPARDALMQLEQEGLVVSKSTGRYVIKPTERDVREIYEVRLALESVAVQLAAAHANPQNCQALQQNLAQWEEAIVAQDRYAFARCDVDFHLLVWRQSDNHHLEQVLHAKSGAIFMFAASNADNYDWREALVLHIDLAAAICAGDSQAAVSSLEKHMHNSLQRLLPLFT